MSAAWLHRVNVVGISLLGFAACGGGGGTGDNPAISSTAGTPGSATGPGTGTTPGGGTVTPGGTTAGRAASGTGVVGTGTSGAPGAATGTGGTGAVPGNGTIPGGTVPGTGVTVPDDGRIYGSWKMMGYDNLNNYFNPTEKILSVANAPMLKEKWRAKVTGFPPGSPTIAQGRVLVGASGGAVALSLKDGSKLWERTDWAATSSIAIDGNFGYIHTNPAELWKFDITTGKEVWGPVKTYMLTDCDGESSPILSGSTVL